MSLLPYILSELQDLSGTLGEAPRHRGVYDNLLDLDDLLLVRDSPRSLLHVLDDELPLHHQLVLRPARQLRRLQSARHPFRGNKLNKKHALVQKDEADKNAFAVSVDVQQFRPEELSVQVFKDEGFVVVEGKHEERPDEHGYIQRQFTRRYKLPADVDPDTVTSRISSDGVLQLSAPSKNALPALKTTVRNVPITHTDMPAVESSASSDGQDKNEGEKERVNGEEKMKS